MEDRVFDLTNNKKIKVDKYEGRTIIHFRQYTDDYQIKEDLAMTTEEFDLFLEHLNQIKHIVQTYKETDEKDKMKNTNECIKRTIQEDVNNQIAGSEMMFNQKLSHAPIAQEGNILSNIKLYIY